MNGEMNAIDNIAAREAQSAVARLPAETPLEDKLKAAMKITKDHWLLVQMGPNQGRQMRAAIAGVVLHLGMEHPDSKRIIAEHQALVKAGSVLEALQRGVRVDLEAMAEEQENEEKFEPIGLLTIWKSL